MKTTERQKANPTASPIDASGAAATPAAAAAKAKSDDPSAEEARVVEGTMADNDTVERRLKADGLPPATVNAIAT
jgi:hypothetical protein